jgi:hypothetical protein
MWNSPIMAARQNQISSSGKLFKRKHVDQLLDAALAETFPASDSVSIDMRQPEDDRLRPSRKAWKAKVRSRQK